MAPKKTQGMASSQKGQRNNPSVSQKRTGDYSLNTNRPVFSRNRGPKVSSSSGGKGIVISNTERLSSANVNGDGTIVYKKTGFSLNPASASIFPWLSTIARGYQLYRWKSIKVSYVPAVATTETGYVEAGVFYDYEDYVTWFSDTTSLSSLSLLGEYATGPPYAGGQLSTTEDKRGTSMTNWFGVCPDVNTAHRRYPWLTVDPTPATDHTHNLAVGAMIAFQTLTTTGSNRVWGVPFISYEIEFLHPTVPAFNSGSIPAAGLSSRAGRGLEEQPMCTGGCDPFPPPRVPVEVPLPPSEGGEQGDPEQPIV